MRTTISAVGDFAITQGMPRSYDGFDAVREWLVDSDIRVGNLETCITNGNTYASSFSGGTWMKENKNRISIYYSK